MAEYYEDDNEVNDLLLENELSQDDEFNDELTINELLESLERSSGSASSLNTVIDNKNSNNNSNNDQTENNEHDQENSTGESSQTLRRRLAGLADTKVCF